MPVPTIAPTPSAMRCGQLSVRTSACSPSRRSGTIGLRRNRRSVMRWAPPLGAGYVWAACKGVGAQRKMRVMDVGTDWWRMAALGWGADIPLFTFVYREVETPIGTHLAPRDVGRASRRARGSQYG